MFVYKQVFLKHKVVVLLFIEIIQLGINQNIRI